MNFSSKFFPFLPLEKWRNDISCTRSNDLQRNESVIKKFIIQKSCRAVLPVDKRFDGFRLVRFDKWEMNSSAGGSTFEY